MDGSSRLLVVRHWDVVATRAIAKGRQCPRIRVRRDRRFRFYDKNGRQSHRERARHRSQHHHHRKSPAFREQMRIRHAFFIPLQIDAPCGRLYFDGIAA
jgi:hypothetical protein